MVQALDNKIDELVFNENETPRERLVCRKYLRKLVLRTVWKMILLVILFKIFVGSDCGFWAPSLVKWNHFEQSYRDFIRTF